MLPLVGTWRLDRTVLDRRSGLRGCVHGTLTVGSDGSWLESGTFRWDGRVVPVSRHLALRILDGEWWMTFADGRPFHPWRPHSWVTHPCGADLYRGFVALGPQRMRIVWEVAGPAKDQRLVSVFRPARVTAR